MSRTINKSQLISIVTIIFFTIVLGGWMLMSSEEEHHEHTDEHGHEAEEHEMEKGPHGGRMLSQDGFGVELTIYETGLPPEFRVYVYHDQKPISPDKVDLTIELQRLGNKLDRIAFTPQNEYLRGNSVVYEPHSFDVSVKAGYQGKTYAWQFENLEGRTTIASNMAKEMGIQTEAVGPVNLIETRTLTGRVETNPNRLSRVRPRFAGVVKQLHHELGDAVRAGETLATIQSNESLQNYQVKAPINGVIVKRNIQVGEATGEEPLFIITDLSEVWVELDVFVRDLETIKPGQPLVVESLDGEYKIATTIDWVSPLTAHASQSVRARASVANVDGKLRPGQFIRGHVTVAERPIPLAVRQSALQRFRDFQVVFAQFGDIYEVRMLELGRRNADWVEVLGGIEPGTQYVTKNSYLIKADIEKSGASHDH